MPGLRLITGTILASTLVTAQPAIANQFRDWFVACDEALSCRLQTDNPQEGLYAFGFERASKANAPVIPFISADPGYGNSSRIILAIDGNEFALSPQSAQTRNGVMYFPGQANDFEMLNAMMAGNNAKLTFEQPLGLRSVSVSLAGVTASALYLDEAQQRVERRDAIKAVGTGTPRDAVSRVTALKSQSVLPPKVFELWSANDGECSDNFGNGDPIANYGGMFVSGSGERRGKLYILPCGGPGAYNLTFIAIAEDESRNKARRLYFPTMTRRGPSVMDFAINVNWEPVKNQLSAFAKGRGLGDCGTASVWEWGGGYHSEFTLVEERSKDECDGKDTEWPKTWPLE